MKVFVTGATGFIGGHVVRQLLASGHEVIALVRDRRAATYLSQMGAEAAVGDLLDRDSLRAGMAGVDGVFHIAGWYELGARDTSMAVPINVDGTRNVLTVMRELGVPKGVYTSSLAVYSNTHGRVVDESYRYDGPHLNEYDRTKWLAHYEVALPMIQAGLPLVIMQPGVVYGPGDHSLLHEMLVLYLKGMLPAVSAGAAYCWSHVEDCAWGHILAMEIGEPGETYIIGGPCHTIVEALRVAERLTGIPAPRLIVSPGVIRAAASLLGMEALGSLGDATYLGDSTKAERDLGWRARPLEVGLRDLLYYEMRRMGKQPRPSG
jgi:nucleoside-diphosphate-sugar epimerase